MIVSEIIATLQAVQGLYGDIAITGGTLTQDMPLRHITVTDTDGMQISPHDPNCRAGSSAVDGVFLD